MTNFQEKIHSESFGGYLLFLAAVLAIILNNSPLSFLYNILLHTIFTIQLGLLKIEKPLLLWVNDGLMTVFFLLVGLELKREILKGALKDIPRLILPIAAAIAGFIVPIVIYIYFNHHNTLALRGWAIPAATDIAFSLAILSLLGSRIPNTLKIFLTALAIIDDILAILIIAIFYTTQLSWASLYIAGLSILSLYVLNNSGVKQLLPYIIIGIILWISVAKSGVHATLSGIVLAFAIPMEDAQKTEYSPLILLEQTLIPWVTYAVLPLFAFANAGFSFKGLSFTSLNHNIPFGIICGLFFGKQLGIFTTCYVLVKTKIAALPKQITWIHMYGMALLCGVGFTMSLFIGSLAFHNFSFEYARMVRLGILTGSALSGLLGYLVLYCCSQKVED